MWWSSAVNLSFFLCLAACRMRSSPCDTVARFCARSVLCWLAFPSALALGSTNSAADCSALFVGFTATMAGADLLRPCLLGHCFSPSPCRPLREAGPPAEPHVFPLPAQEPPHNTR